MNCGVIYWCAYNVPFALLVLRKGPPFEAARVISRLHFRKCVKKCNIMYKYSRLGSSICSPNRKKIHGIPPNCTNISKFHHGSMSPDPPSEASCCGARLRTFSAQKLSHQYDFHCYAPVTKIVIEGINDLNRRYEVQLSNKVRFKYHAGKMRRELL